MRSSELVRATACACTCARLSTHEGVATGARSEAAKACRSPATFRATTCTCATSTSAGSTRTAGSVPPLRGTPTALRCARAWQTGTIDLICSDHTPVDDDAASKLPFSGSRARATALELLLPLHAQVGAGGRLALPAALRPPHFRTGARARPRRGTTRTRRRGRCLRVFDPDAVLDRRAAGAQRARGKNTPFLGLELPGRVRFTLVGGQVVYEG